MVFGKTGGKLWVAVVVGIAFLGLGSSVALAASFNCGDTIDTGGVVTLTDDVGPCDDDTNPALTVVGPTTLDLNNHKVFCEDNNNIPGVPNGVLTTGAGARLKNGTVEGCDDNVNIDGDNHSIRNVVSKNSVGDCFDVNEFTSGGSIKFVVAKDCGDDGVDMDGDNTELIASEIGPVVDNCVASNGDSNTVAGNKISDCTDRGVDIDGNSTKVLANKVEDCGLNGIRADDGSSNLILFNVAKGNAEEGIAIESSDNMVKFNVMRDNGVGLLVTSGDNMVKFNVMRDNGVGLLVTLGAGDNTIKFNTSRGQTPDMQDDNPDCGTNTWMNNFFDTADPESCIN